MDSSRTDQSGYKSVQLNGVFTCFALRLIFCGSMLLAAFAFYFVTLARISTAFNF